MYSGWTSTTSSAFQIRGVYPLVYHTSGQQNFLLQRVCSKNNKHCQVNGCPKKSWNLPTNHVHFDHFLVQEIRVFLCFSYVRIILFPFFLGDLKHDLPHAVFTKIVDDLTDRVGDLERRCLSAGGDGDGRPWHSWHFSEKRFFFFFMGFYSDSMRN